MNIKSIKPNVVIQKLGDVVNKQSAHITNQVAAMTAFEMAAPSSNIGDVVMKKLIIDSGELIAKEGIESLRDVVSLIRRKPVFDHSALYDTFTRSKKGLNTFCWGYDALDTAADKLSSLKSSIAKKVSKLDKIDFSLKG